MQELGTRLLISKEVSFLYFNAKKKKFENKDFENLPYQ
jgi:hypothetical protein